MNLNKGCIEIEEWLKRHDKEISMNLNKGCIEIAMIVKWGDKELDEP